MPLDLTDPKTIQFLIENIEKENTSRQKWINKHKDQLQQAATLKKPPKNYFESDVQAHSISQGMSALKRDHISAARNRLKVPITDGTFIPGVKDQRRGHSIVDVGLGDTKEDPRLVKTEDDLTPDPVMRPVDPKIAKIRTEEGCAKYLHERANLLPEKRYYFAECVSWDYGWRLKDSKGSWRATYGRQALFMNTLRNRVGPPPDPQYYKTADIPEANKCKDS